MQLETNLCLQIDYGDRGTVRRIRTGAARPAQLQACPPSFSPQNSPASPLRHTAASVQITVAPSILHPNNGGDPDDPSHITPFGEGKMSSIRL